MKKTVNYIEVLVATKTSQEILKLISDTTQLDKGTLTFLKFKTILEETNKTILSEFKTESDDPEKVNTEWLEYIKLGTKSIMVPTLNSTSFESFEDMYKEKLEISIIDYYAFVSLFLSEEN